MATYTWSHGGSPATDITVAPAGVFGSGDATFVAAVSTWNGTADENGDTGTVNITTDPSPPFVAQVQVLMQLEDPGISAATPVDTIRIVFDWAVTNGPMGTATAVSQITSDWDGTPDAQGSGSSTGNYDRTVSGATFGTPTFGDLFAIVGVGAPGATGFAWVGSYTAGVFSAHNRRFAVSNLQIIASDGATPVVTDVDPAHGDTAGGTVVTLTGTDLDAGTNAFFNGTPATSYSASSSTEATCIAPAHAVGQVTVTVV